MHGLEHDGEAAPKGPESGTQAAVLALVLARGGSKSIPRKNIRPLAGFPLVAYSIAAAQAARRVTRIVVSTDDEEIAAVARSCGAEVPFLRPEELARDETLDLPVFVHALQWLARTEGYRPEVVVHLRPTSPLCRPEWIDQAVDLLRANPAADAVRSVTPPPHTPYKMWKIDPATGLLSPLLAVAGIPEPYNAPRQLLPECWWQTGHLDAVRPETILGRGSMTGTAILPLRIDPRYAVDIDTPMDWELAEVMIRSGTLEVTFPRASVAVPGLRR